jgi:hypothetical protein
MEHPPPEADSISRYNFQTGLKRKFLISTGPEGVTNGVLDKWSVVCKAFSKLPKDEDVNLLQQSTLIFCICNSMNNLKENQTLSNMLWFKFTNLLLLCYCSTTPFSIFMNHVDNSVINPFSASLQRWFISTKFHWLIVDYFSGYHSEMFSKEYILS